MSKNTPQSSSQLERDLENSQQRLAEDINELIARFHPKNVLAEGKHKTKTALKSFFVADNGEVNLPRAAAAGAAVVGAIVLAVVKGSRG
ncbi:DUF3618 domain-containing protein [Micrococcales bacterium 31B]|nr:DUF3618 domain-containing protein [Micrococcales bacterium 31B]